jgi:hypothetical protein
MIIENGTKIGTGPDQDCRIVAIDALETLLSTIDSLVAFVLGNSGENSGGLDFSLLPVFAILLVYKVAKVATEKLVINANNSESGEGKSMLKRLKHYREFLKITGQRWGSGSKSS